MSVLLAALVVIVFSVLLERLDVASRAREAIRQSSLATRVMRDPTLSDRDKEAELRRSAMRLVRLAGSIIGLSLLALLLPLVGVFTLDWLGGASASEVLAVLQRVDFLVAAALLGSISYYLSVVVARR